MTYSLRSASIGRRSKALAVLAEEVPRAQAAGYQFVPVSYLLDRPSDLAAAE